MSVNGVDLSLTSKGVAVAYSPEGGSRDTPQSPGAREVHRRADPGPGRRR